MLFIYYRCGPCQFMGPILNEVSISMGDAIQVVKIDTEKYPQIANKYNIEALPTFILFKDGKPCDRFVSFFSFLFSKQKPAIMGENTNNDESCNS